MPLFRAGDKVCRIANGSPGMPLGSTHIVRAANTYQVWFEGSTECWSPYNFVLSVEQAPKPVVQATTVAPVVYEVGKQYVSGYSDQKFVCVGFDIDKNALFQFYPRQDHNLKIFRAGGVSGNLTEYVEPKTGKKWMNVYESSEGPDVGYPCDTRAEADMAAKKRTRKRLACIEINWTEGEGLNNASDEIK